jgi:hypothetical protein
MGFSQSKSTAIPQLQKKLTVGLHRVHEGRERSLSVAISILRGNSMKYCSSEQQNRGEYGNLERKTVFQKKNSNSHVFSAKIDAAVDKITKIFNIIFASLNHRIVQKFV